MDLISTDNPFDSQFGQQLQKEITSLIEDTLAHVKEKWRLDFFEGSYVMSSGSAVEGTKVGAPDEFDFNIMITSLTTDFIFDLLFLRLNEDTENAERSLLKENPILKEFIPKNENKKIIISFA